MNRVAIINTDTDKAIREAPRTHEAPEYIDVVNTECLDKFGIYFNGVLVVSGDSEPGFSRPADYCVMLRLLRLDYEVHVTPNRGDKPLPERFGDLEILNPDCWFDW